MFLLSQDMEIDAETFEYIKDSIAQTFLLQHQQIGNGVVMTPATKNMYFGG